MAEIINRIVGTLEALKSEDDKKKKNETLKNVKRALLDLFTDDEETKERISDSIDACLEEGSLSEFNALIQTVKNLNYIAKEENEVIEIWKGVFNHPNFGQWRREHEGEWSVENATVNAIEFLAKVLN